jgi:uncharacterized membrane protein YfbV (UPF0208 family)
MFKQLFMIPKHGVGSFTKVDKLFLTSIAIFTICTQIVLTDTANLYRFASLLTIGG